MPRLLTPIAVVIAGLLIASSILITFRWSETGMTRLDRWTGEIALCVVARTPTNAAYVHCGVQD